MLGTRLQRYLASSCGWTSYGVWALFNGNGKAVGAFRCGSGLGRFASSILGDAPEWCKMESGRTVGRQYGQVSRGCQRRDVGTWASAVAVEMKDRRWGGLHLVTDYKHGSWGQTEESASLTQPLVWVTVPIARDGSLSLMQASFWPQRHFYYFQVYRATRSELMKCSSSALMSRKEQFVFSIYIICTSGGLPKSLWGLFVFLSI